ncbi:MAG: hypothetical protein EA387_04480 [Nitriliruptor sp.]|nr:MAG: hypothetical protein EA387_04480 [Nitriliruptor sp.]
MGRRMSTMWVGAVAAVVLAACGAVVEEPLPEFQVSPTEPGQEAPSGDPEASELDDAGGQDHDRGTDRDDPGEEARGAGPTQDGDDGETPWNLLPEDDRPAPVEHLECEPVGPSPVAC